MVAFETEHDGDQKPATKSCWRINEAPDASHVDFCVVPSISSCRPLEEASHAKNQSPALEDKRRRQKKNLKKTTRPLLLISTPFPHRPASSINLSYLRERSRGRSRDDQLAVSALLSQLTSSSTDRLFEAGDGRGEVRWRSIRREALVGELPLDSYDLVRLLLLELGVLDRSASVLVRLISSREFCVCVCVGLRGFCFW